MSGGSDPRGQGNRGPGSWRPILTAGDAAVIVGLSMTVLLTYLLSDTTSLLPTAEDLAEMAPYRMMAAQSLLGGHFPLWTPQVLCGLPLAAWPHSSALYPLGLIFGVWDYARALPVNLCLHLAIFGLGLQAMLRSLSIRREAALLSAVFVTFGPVAAYWQFSFLPTIYTGAYTPWLFAFAFLLIRSRKVLYVSGMAVSFALQVAGSRYDLIARELMIIGCIAAALLAMRKGRAAVSLWLPAGAVGALMAACLVLSHYEYVSRSIRTIPLSMQYFGAYQRDLKHVGLFLFWVMTPGAALGLSVLRRGARPWLLAGAGLVIGVCLLWLVAPSWWLWIAFHLPLLRKLLWPNVSLIFAYLALAVLVGEGLASWLGRGLDAGALQRLAAISGGFAILFMVFGGPVRSSISGTSEMALFEAALLNKTASGAALAVLAAFLAVLAYLRRRRSGQGTPFPFLFGRVSMLAICTFIIACDVLGGAFLGSMRFPCSARPLIRLGSGDATAFRPGRAQDIFPWSYWRDSKLMAASAADRGERSIDGFISMPIREYGEFISLIAPSALHTEDGHLTSEQFMSALKEGDYISPASIRLLDFLSVAVLKTERTNLKLGPVYHFAWAPEGSLNLEGDWTVDAVGMKLQQQGAGGWESTFPAVAGFRFESRIAPDTTAPVMVEVLHAAKDPSRRLVYARAFSHGRGGPALDVPLPASDSDRYFLQGAALPITADGCRLAWRDPRLFSAERAFQLQSSSDGVDTLLNPGVLPEAFVVHKIVLVADRGKRLAYILEHGDRLGQEAVLEAGLKAPVRKAAPGGDDLGIEEYGEQKIMLRGRLGTPGLVVMSDTYYPGWRAWDERGRETMILRADHAFRAFWLDEGQHQMVLRFEPAGFRIGLWASLASLGLALVVGIMPPSRSVSKFNNGTWVDSRAAL